MFTQWAEWVPRVLSGVLPTGQLTDVLPGLSPTGHIEKCITRVPILSKKSYLGNVTRLCYNNIQAMFYAHWEDHHNIFIHFVCLQVVPVLMGCVNSVRQCKYGEDEFIQ